MRNKKLLWITGSLITLIAIVCYQKFNKQIDEPEKKIKIEKTAGILISTDFHTNAFSSIEEAIVLKELKLCDTTIQTSQDPNRPACTANFFRVFPLKKDLSIAQGCMVLMKAGVNHFPVRRFIVYEKEGDQMVQANGFIGYPIEFRAHLDTYDDVVVRFFERYEGQKYFYNCLFTWKQKRYQFVRCEQINDAAIKPEKQQQVSTEILQILNEKQLLF